MKTEDRTS